MKGTITWSCVACQETDYRRSNIIIRSYDPGSRVAAALSMFLPSKRRVNIHTLCKLCRDESGLLSRDDQLRVILKKRDQFCFNRSGSWARSTWDFWLSCDECQSLNDSMKDSDHVNIYLFSNVSINWTVCYWAMAKISKGSFYFDAIQLFTRK